MQLFPESADDQQREAHSIETLIPEMGYASKAMEEELNEMDVEAQAILKELQATVGDLSDLRYGRFSKTPGANGGDVAFEVVQSLQRIQQLSSNGNAG